MYAARGFFLVLAGPIAVLALLIGTGAWAAGSELTVQGKLVDLHSDDFASGRASHQYRLVTDERTYELEFAVGNPHLPPAGKVTVRGKPSGDRIFVADGGVEAIAGNTSSGSTTGAKKIAVILFNFSDNTAEPYTPTYARGIAFTNTNSVAAYYGEASWGKLTLSGDVFGWFTIPDASTSCSFSAWADSANQVSGVDLASYDYIVYAFPSTSSCGWTGTALLGGRYSWLNGTTGMKLRAMAHELGHNVGTHHASSYSCVEDGVRVSLSADAGNCTRLEYGDPFTVMGSASRYQLSNFSRGNVGWLQAANTQTVTTSGSYLLRPIGDYDPSGVQVLRIQRTSSAYLTLEFRQPHGTSFDTFSSSDPVVNGVSIRLAPGYDTSAQSQLVDATPDTSQLADAPLVFGKTLLDPLSRVSITTTAVSSSAATVQVAFGQDTLAPSAPTNLSATATDASHIALTWSPSTDDVGVAGYKLYRGGSYLTTVTSTSYADSGLVSSTTYTYTVTAYDAAGKTSSASPSVSATTAPVADTQPPSAPGDLQATVGKGHRVQLSWTAAADNVGVTSYEIVRDDVTIDMVEDVMTYVDNARRGVHIYYVVAVDAAGNRSLRSILVTAAI